MRDRNRVHIILESLSHQLTYSSNKHDRTGESAAQRHGHDAYSGEAGGLVNPHDRKLDVETPRTTTRDGPGRDSDRFQDQPGSAHASDHRTNTRPQDVDTEIGAKSGECEC